MKPTREAIRQAAENDLYTFARLVNPHRVYGDIHKQLFEWWTREDAKSCQLVLFPRDHQKSHCLAVRVAWEITRNPAITILYVSATALLAEKQLYAIKNILDSKVYRRYWPEMIHPDEGKREKWTTTEIAVDHPKRAEEGVRDSTVLAAGLTTNIVGLHCDVAALDDLVVPSNVGTQEGRNKVAALYSQLASIESANCQEWVVGTRYDVRDLYSTLLEITEEKYDESGELISSEPVYEVFERVVEDSPERNGSGEFLWPVQTRSDGKRFGFDAQILARKRGKYVDKAQFYAQYYNDPNDSENAPVQMDWIQYYDKAHLEQKNGHWYLRNKRLNVFAAMDFAFSMAKSADYTALVVIGIDGDNNIYVLDIDRFKTSSYRMMFDAAARAHHKWEFIRLRAEVSSSQVALIQHFKDCMAETGHYFNIDPFNPVGHGTKDERITATLRPRYENGKMWHYRGGNCQVLEDELRVQRPAHDDVKDALAAAVELAKPPARAIERSAGNNVVVGHGRFGGMAYG